MPDRVWCRVLVFVVALGGFAPGCATMRGPAVSESAGDASDDGWLAGVRRSFTQAAREIEADLDFHENEGLDAFAPDAADQVNMLRGDMNGPSGITR